MDESKEQEEQEDTSKIKNEMRCTQFEYTSSDSEEEFEMPRKKNKISFPVQSNKKFKSSSNLVVGEKKEKKKKTKIYLSRYIRMILFFLLLIFSVIIDLDEGIIVSSYSSFAQDLHMSDFQFGSLNSITTIGKIISLVYYMIVINKNHRKFILVSTSFIHGLAFFCFFINDNYYYIAILELLTSFCKVFITVYMPVWIDQFGIKKYKTILLTLVFMVTSYGRIVGAWIGTVIFENEWKKAFMCCGLIFFVLSISLFVIPQKYYSTKYMFVEQQKKITGNVVEKLVPTKSNEFDFLNSEDSKIKKDIENMNDIEYINDEKNSNKNPTIEIIKETEREGDTTDIIEDNLKKEKLIYDYDNNENEEDKIFKSLSFISKLKIVLLNECFMFSSLSRASIFFTFKIIHVFLKKYAFEALYYTNEITFFYYYSLTTILAPSLGSLIGGAICNKYLGGYESKSSIWLILFFGTTSVIFITLVRVVTDFNYLLAYIFGYFFSVSAFLPTISGYIINSLHKELKGFGSSFDSLITNVLGKLPSPIIYGIINDRYKKENPKYAWDKSLMIFYLGTIFIYLTCLFKWRINNKKGKFKYNVVKKTMKDAYTFNRSSLTKAEKPIPKFNIVKKIQNAPTEMKEIENVEKKTHSKFFKKNISNKKFLLNKLQRKQQKENDEKNINDDI